MSDFQYIKSTIIKNGGRDTDFPLRQFNLDMLTRVLRGRLYDHIAHPFGQEQSEAKEYIPIRDRRPSARHNLCRVVVDDAVSLLFSEGHFPTIHIDGDSNAEGLRESLEKVVKACSLNALMIDAATKGSVGSVAILMRVLESRLFFDAMETQFLTPVWKATAPDTLVKVIERYKIKGAELAPLGYPNYEAEQEFWWHVEYTTTQELRYVPYSVKDAKEKGFAPNIDRQNTTTHNLGFVPIVWVKNLPGGDGIDGEPTFPTEAIDTQIEIDYQLSQAGRGLKYSSDPLLMIKEPAGSDNQLIKGGNALVVAQEGDAKLLEISGSAANAVIEYCKHLRENALELMHGNRASAEKISAAQSGRAMELMNQALIWLADRLRISYGEGALLSLLKMIVAASRKYQLIVDGQKIGELPDLPVTLKWPPWYAPTYADLQAMATALQILIASGVLSRESAIKQIAEYFDIEDTQAEKALIDVEQQAALKMQQELAKPAQDKDSASM